MLSFGIRFGEGFDRHGILKVMQSIPTEFNYDLLVIGSSPGGVACAREAGLAGMKTAILKWQRYTPAEEEGINESLEEMAVALQMNEENENSPRANDKNSSEFASLSPKTSKSLKSSHSVRGSQVAFNKKGSFEKTHWPRNRNKYASRKVRRSRLDLSNELFKRGQECRKLMRTASNFGDGIVEAIKCGWRVFATTPNLSINWNKMTENIMDYVMEENWKLMSLLSDEGIEVIEGRVSFENEHTVKVRLLNLSEYEITAHTICLAPSADYIFPEDVVGAECFGINCDDFYRMNEAPGKTLIVGSTPEAMECAGIVANCGFPVTVISRSKILKGYDSEISQMIVNDLKKKGVVFLENTTLKSIEVPEEGKNIVASFTNSFHDKEDSNALQESVVGRDETFDTVIFAVGKKISIDFLRLKNTGISYDPITQKIRTDIMDATSVPNIYAIGDIVEDRPDGLAVSELAGRLLGRRLFNNGQEIMDYSMTPYLILTPTEYAFVGLSEETALYRLGAECVSIYHGSFKPLDYVIRGKNDECFAKVIVFKPKDRVIGLHFYGPDAGDIIQGFAAAVKIGLTMTQLQTLAGMPTTKAREILRLKESRSYPDEDRMY